MLSTYLPMALHEFRSQLHVIGLISESLHRTSPPGAHRELVSSLLDSSAHLRRLADDLLDASRLDAGRFQLQPEATDLVQLLASLMDDVALQAESKGLNIGTQYDRKLPQQVAVDPTRLRQVLANLLVNAIKFTEAGSINIAARLHGVTAHRVAWVSIEVQDSGQGIPASIRTALFEPFATTTVSDAAATGAHPGSGLGLAISRQLVGQMGGTLRLKSTGDSGTVFEVFLPTPLVD